MADKIYHQMVQDGLPTEKLATLVQDGPNVNETIFHVVERLIKEDHPEFPGLVDLGSCVIHTVHNAFLTLK